MADLPDRSLALRLPELTRRDLSSVGGKAANLGELIKNGFPVPEGFATTMEAYSLFLKKNGLGSVIEESLDLVDYDDPSSVERCSRAIREAFDNASLPRELVEEIVGQYNYLKLQRVAVRSSATSEDLPRASFAGQLKSYLNVSGIPEVLRHVKLCYASFWTARAISYRQRNRIPHRRVSMSVIVQAMVPARSAGVLFTVNPVTSEASELLFESNFGLGEAVVSGRAIPDKFTVARTSQPAGDSYEIVSREIGVKNLMAAAPRADDKSGVDYIELRGERRQQPSLDDQEILRLARIGKEIESSLGSPQNVEWAVDDEGKIMILQSRPITSLEQAPEEEIVWTRGYSDDYWNDPVTPLFFDLLGDKLTEIVNVELNKIMGYFKPGFKKTDQLLKLHHARAYFNLEVLKRKVGYEIPAFLRNDNILNYFPEGRGPYGKETIKELPIRLGKRLLARIRVKLLDSKGSVGKTAKAYEAWTEEAFTPFWEAFDTRMAEIKGGPLPSLLSLADELDELMEGHFRLVRYGIHVHNIRMNLMAQYLLARCLGQEDGRKVYPILVSGLRHKTGETNERINQLAIYVQSIQSLKKMILETPSHKLYEAFASMSDLETRCFVDEFDSFIREFGARGFNREPYYPRWHEAPWYVFDVLKSLVTDQPQDLEAVEEERTRLLEETEESVERAIKSQAWGRMKWKLFSTVLSHARDYIVFREDQRFNLDRWITMNRRIYLDVGGILREYEILK
ncbi:MAG: PEP/pyruvate-binding domain-containing protein, partial [Candidatus Bathyarchaeota archaeon]